MANPLTRQSREMLETYRDREAPRHEVAVRSWHAVAERLRHPEVGHREAWVNRLPPVDPDEYASRDDMEIFDEPMSTGPAVNTAWYAKSVGATLSIAAGVLLMLRFVGLQVTTLAESARGEAIEAPYQSGAERDGGEARVREGEAERGGNEAARRSAKTRGTAPDAPVEVPTPAPTAEPAQAAPTSPAADAAGPAAAATPARPTRAASGKAATRKAPAETQVDDLEAELALIRRATTAKGQGKHGEAKQALDEHRRRFPRGALAKERAVLRAEVACARGEQATARRLAEDFLARHPSDPLAGRMQRACTTP